MDLTIKGIQQAQNQMAKTLARLEAPEPRRRVLLYATAEAHRYLVGITHVDTGAYRASQRMKVATEHGELYVAATTTNPRTGERPVEYSLYEEERGGQHAAYQRTVDEAGPRILERVMVALSREMTYGG